MNETSHPLKSLVLDVIDLCQQTLALAETGVASLDAIAPLRAAAEAVGRELDSLEELAEVDAIEPVMPYEIDLDAEPSTAWLMGSDAGAANGSWIRAQR